MKDKKEKKRRSNIYIPNGTLMSYMVQECSLSRVLEIFFKEPTSVHFIKEISRRINLAHTSVRKHIKSLAKKNLILKKKSHPFDGYISNRENEDFLWMKRTYNFSSLKPLRDFIAEKLYPQLIVIFGSYFLGEDIESSDIDVFILSKSKKNLDFESFEELYKRKINAIVASDVSKINQSLKKKIMNGFVIHGSF